MCKYPRCQLTENVCFLQLKTIDIPKQFLVLTADILGYIYMSWGRGTVAKFPVYFNVTSLRTSSFLLLPKCVRNHTLCHKLVDEDHVVHERKRSGGRSSHSVHERQSHGCRCRSCSNVNGTCARCHRWSGVNRDNCEV